MLGSFVDWQRTPSRLHFHEINESQTYVFPQIPRKLVQMQIPRHHPSKNWLIGKEPDAEKDWGQEKKGETENELIGWYHQLNEDELEHTPGDSEGQGSLVCYPAMRLQSQTWLSNWTTSGPVVESTSQCRGDGFNLWSGKIPHAAEWLSPCAVTTESASATT